MGAATPHARLARGRSARSRAAMRCTFAYNRDMTRVGVLWLSLLVACSNAALNVAAGRTDLPRAAPADIAPPNAFERGFVDAVGGLGVLGFWLGVVFLAFALEDLAGQVAAPAAAAPTT